MNRIRRFILLLCTAAMYIMIMTELNYAQEPPEGWWFAPDDRGVAFIGYSGNMLYILGTTRNPTPPPYDDLITFEGSPCAHAEYVGGWNCQNPVDESGFNYLVYYYRFQIYYDKDCNKTLYARSPDDPDGDEVGFVPDPQKYEISVKMMDACGIDMKERNTRMPGVLDRDEVFYFYARVEYTDENVTLPEEIAGKMFFNGAEFNPVIMGIINQEPGMIEYVSESFILNEIFPNYWPGILRFELPYGVLGCYSISISEAERFDIADDDILFEGNYAITKNSNMAEVCYPPGSKLEFGANIQNPWEQWPSCPTLSADLFGYVDNDLITTDRGNLNPGEFYVEPVNSSFNIDPYFHEEVLDFDWTMRLHDNSVERPVDGPRIKVYHGFMGRPMHISDPLLDNTIYVGDRFEVMADPWPNLQEVPNIMYSFDSEPVENDPNPGLGHFEQIGGQESKRNFFIGDTPGDLNLYYLIEDINIHYMTRSQPLLVHIKPKLEILTPTVGYKFCYSGDGSDNQAELAFQGNTLPMELKEDIEWDITTIDDGRVFLYCSIGIPAKGESGIFYYKNLPMHNSSFGAKVLKAELTNYDLAIIEAVYLFFDADARNSPNVGWPNWFYYWKDGAVVPTMDSSDVTYIFNSSDLEYGHYDPNYDFISLSGQAGTIYPLYEIDDFNFVFQEVEGIDCCATTLIHERFHQEIRNNWRPPNGKWWKDYGDHPYFNPDIDVNPHDLDGDLLPNSYEEDISRESGFFVLNTNNADTYDVFGFFGSTEPTYRDQGDEELMARYFSEGSKGIKELDWSAGPYAKQWP